MAASPVAVGQTTVQVLERKETSAKKEKAPAAPANPPASAKAAAQAEAATAATSATASESKASSERRGGDAAVGGDGEETKTPDRRKGAAARIPMRAALRQRQLPPWLPTAELLRSTIAELTITYFISQEGGQRSRLSAERAAEMDTGVLRAEPGPQTSRFAPADHGLSEGSQWQHTMADSAASRGG